MWPVVATSTPVVATIRDEKPGGKHHAVGVGRLKRPEEFGAVRIGDGYRHDVAEHRSPEPTGRLSTARREMVFDPRESELDMPYLLV